MGCLIIPNIFIYHNIIKRNTSENIIKLRNMVLLLLFYANTWDLVSKVWDACMLKNGKYVKVWELVSKLTYNFHSSRKKENFPAWYRPLPTSSKTFHTTDFTCRQVNTSHQSNAAPVFSDPSQIYWPRSIFYIFFVPV